MTSPSTRQQLYTLLGQVIAEKLIEVDVDDLIEQTIQSNTTRQLIRTYVSREIDSNVERLVEEKFKSRPDLVAKLVKFTEEALDSIGREKPGLIRSRIADALIDAIRSSFE